MMNSLKTLSICNLLGARLRAGYGQQCMFFQTSSAYLNSNNRNSKKKIIKPVKRNMKSQTPTLGVVDIMSRMTIENLASVLQRTHEEVFEALRLHGVFSKYNCSTAVVDDLELIKKVVKTCGYKFKMASLKNENEVKEKEFTIKRRLPDVTKFVRRPPVVTIMGHVDHGKTTLLDSLRNSNVVEKEFGGITQHIGAFSVEFKDGESVTFIDTPGHAAFSAMRARGANVTDIVVLVVAADDGVMKQTIESLKFAQEAGVPIIVAINKCDKPNINIERTKKELLQHGIQIEELGGDVQAVAISALKGMNLDQLMECILAQAEVNDLHADPTSHVEAVCIESKTDQSRGKVATVLIKHGTLKRGQVLVTGEAWAKVRGIFNDKGQPIDKAEPSSAVEVIGWKSLPSAGDLINEVNSADEAKKLVDEFVNREYDKKVDADNEIIKEKMAEDRKVYVELRNKKLKSGFRRGSIFHKFQPKDVEDSRPKLNIIVKGDVDGSVEAIMDIIDTYSSDQCQLNILSYGVGPVTESEVEMAKLFNGVIYAFNTKTLNNTNSSGVSILNFNIIYKLISSLVEKLNERLPEIMVDEILGEASVQANFSVTEGKHKINVAGCRCTKGQLNKKKSFRLVRDGEVLLEGDLMSLKHFKNEVGTVKNATDCGLSFTDQSVNPQAGDKILCFEKVGKKQKLNWDLDFI